MSAQEALVADRSQEDDEQPRTGVTEASGRPMCSSTELRPQPVEIAEDPGAGEPSKVCGAEGRTRVFETPLRGGQPQQQPGMCPGVAKPGRRPLSLAHQLDYLVAEVSRSSVH